MNNKVYALKQRSFMFNDDNYGQVIKDLYGAILQKSNDQIALREIWKNLERQFFNENSHLYITQNENNLLDNQSFHKIAEKYALDLKNHHEIDVELDDKIYEFLCKINDDELLAILIESDASIFTCIEFNEQTQMFVLWNADTNDYFINDANYPELEPPQVFLTKAQSLESLLVDFNLLDDIPKNIHGSLEQLSETPLLLKSVIDQNKCFKFKNNELSINEPDAQTLIAINAVLREPLFHYKVLTLDAIITIEKISMIILNPLKKMMNKSKNKTY